jgi:AAA+ ATPase superfamily predicted ATPase
MKFLDRTDELSRLHALSRRRDGGLAVLWGRRRVGKTRLLVEWCREQSGIYFVADESSAAVQRRYFAEAVAARLPGFAAVEYPDWRSLLGRLSSDAALRRFRGPIVLDELPYLVEASPDLPSVLQQWLDHDARRGRLVVAVAGSSQRMMQGLVLDAAAPLYGRATEALELRPLLPEWLPAAFGNPSPFSLVSHFAAWGGVPRYWELAASTPGTVERRIDRLVVDPAGPLHREPDRLLLEEIPSAQEVRPLLDAIGAGAHRMSEIAGRVGRPATSLSRPIERLTSLGLAVRETPFGEDPRSSKRSVYRISDPFTRLWFRVVAPARGLLATGTPAVRIALLRRHFPGLVGSAWEELCRLQLPRLSTSSSLGAEGPWGVPGRWWHGAAPEWDMVATTVDGTRCLYGEMKASARPLSLGSARKEVQRLAARPPPDLPRALGTLPTSRALFVPSVEKGVPSLIDGVHVVTLATLLEGVARR